jgi:hypothetical protein
LYVVVFVGWTTALLVRVGPTVGETIVYSPPLVLQLSVAGIPGGTVDGFAVKLKITGDGPCGTFVGV